MMRYNLAILLALLLQFAVDAAAQATEFTYQGKLNDGGFAVTTPRDLRFGLWDLDSSGNQVGSDVVVTNVSFNNGVFTVLLDFGQPAFTGEPRWIEIAVSPPDGNNYTTLAPRQKLTSAPYAVRSTTAASSASLDCSLCITDAHIVSIDGGKVNGPVAQADTANVAGNVTGVVQIANGGTGNITKTFIDLSTDQAGIGGNKTFTGNVSVTSGGKFNGDGSGLTNLNAPVAANAPLTGNGTAESPLGIQSPLAVTSTDRPELQAVTFTCSIVSGSCSHGLLPGKRLVVEHVSGYFRFSSAANANAYLNVFAPQPSGSGTTLFVQPSTTVTLSSGTVDLVFNSFVKAYYEGQLAVNPVYFNGLSQWTVSLSGYYVDLPTAQSAQKGVQNSAAK